MQNQTPLAELSVGVIGGMGPHASADFLMKLIKATPIQEEQDHLHVIMESNPKVPDRNVAIKAIQNGGLIQRESPGVVLAEMGRRLEAAGAGFLVMACNTAHAFEKDIRRAVGIPFASIVEEACDQLKSRASNSSARVGVLAAQGCVDAGLYQRALAKRDLEAVMLDAPLQDRFMQLLYRVKRGDVSSETSADMRQLALSLVEKDVGDIVAGCTEVPLVLSEAALADVLPHPILDATAHLATRCVLYARRIEPMAAHCFQEMEKN